MYMMYYEMETPQGDVELEITYKVTGGKPARINCLPEDATPAEDTEVEVLMIEIDGATTDDTEVWTYVEDKLEDELIQNAMEY